MKQLKHAVVKTPVLGPLVLVIYRAREAARYHWRTLLDIVMWLVKSNETTNYTYDLETSNVRHLAGLISYVLDLNHATVMGYFNELQQNDDLRQHIVDETKRSDLALIADEEARFGRRIGWYAFVRAAKPKVIVETGVDKGLGACILTAALMKNREEGYEGRYFGTDINPAAGYLFTGIYAECGQILYGDSIESLSNFEHTIDLFINDSDHSAEYEAQEYVTIAPKLSDKAIILGDNSDVTDKLLNFSLETDRSFVFFAEKPSKHWFPGGGIGISIPVGQ